MLEHALEKFSPTMICDYMSCPRSFYYKYIAKVEIPQKKIHLLFGGGVHAGIEGIYHKQDPYPFFEKHFVQDKLMSDEQDKFKEYYDLGHEMIKNYAEQHDTLDNLYKLNDGISEKYIKRHLINPLTGETSTLPMAGRIDRLTNGGKIIEYKTAKAKWNPKDMAFKTQTFLYNLWYYSEYGEMPNETLYFILLKKYKKDIRNGETLQVLNHRCTLTDLAIVFDEIEIIIQKINNREFNRPLGFHPMWCDCHLYEKFLNLNM